MSTTTLVALLAGAAVIGLAVAAMARRRSQPTGGVEDVASPEPRPTTAAEVDLPDGGADRPIPDSSPEEPLNPQPTATSEELLNPQPTTTSEVDLPDGGADRPIPDGEPGGPLNPQG